MGLASDWSETISVIVFSLIFPPGYMLGGKGGFSDLGYLYFSLAIYYESTIRIVGDNHRKRTNRRRAPPIQSEGAGDCSQTLNLNLNFQSHTESCD